MDVEKARIIKDIYQRLYKRFGTQNWWPAETAFEVMVGAVLTQSTSWKNVEKAIANLKQAKALDPFAINAMEPGELAQLVHPSGFYKVKTARLRALCKWFEGEWGGRVENFKREKNTLEIRRQLLQIYGVGEETADSILLYAMGRPVFVIDAYTKRVMSRLGVETSGNSYQSCQKLFMDNLPLDVVLFNEFHALFVRLGAVVCKKTPLCGSCCLREVCAFAGR